MNTSLRLSAETTISLCAPLDVMAKLRDHFLEHGHVSGADDHWRVSFEIGVAEATVSEGTVRFRVEAADPTSLAYLQWGVAEHVCEFAPTEKPEIVWQGGAAPGTQLPYFREMRVVRARQVTPRMRRLTLAGDDLARFSYGGMHVRLLLPPQSGVKPVWPVMAADGRQAWPEGPRPAPRVYTIRRIDVAAGEVDIDFVLHAGNEMPGARFAAEAQPGDIVGMTGPGGESLKPAARYILAGDETALPAISRILEELPPHAEVAAFIEIADDLERQELPSRPGMKITWLSRKGRPAGSTTLLADSLRAIDASGDVYVWVGCEHAAARAIRGFLRSERQIPRDRYLVAAYWRKGQSGEVIE